MDQNTLLTKIVDTNERLMVKIITIEERVTKEMVTKEEFNQKYDKVISHIDSFVKLHETLDQELIAPRSKYERLEGRVQQLELKVGLSAT